MRRWKMNTRITIGTVTTIEAAEIAPIGCSNCEPPVKKASVAGTVRALSVEVSVLAKMKTRIAAVNTPGAARGTITLRKACAGVAPSTWAACSSSQGISRKNADST